MRLRAFSIFDQKAKAYMSPFFMSEVGMATRSFTDMVNKDDHPLGAHPEDYVLYEVGQFDDSTGLLAAYDGPELVITALQVVQGDAGSGIAPLSDEIMPSLGGVNHG